MRKQSKKRASEIAEAFSGQIDLAAGRRAFIQSVAFGVAGAAVLGAGGARAEEAQQRTVTDFDVLNFALNLEYLEAEFYQLAAFGRNLPSNLITGRGGNPGEVTGGRQVNFSNNATRSYAIEIANDELNHVRAIRGLLGNSAVARPAINLTDSFTAVAQAANIIPSNGTFDAFANDRNFLLAAFVFEDVGVTAYLGGAPLISNPDYLVAAAKILSVEGYHAGEIRTLLYNRGEFAAGLGISNVRDRLDRDGDRDQFIGNSATTNLIVADRNGVGFPRTPPQVLNIVYGNPNKQPGGFFPNGANGTFR